MKELSLNEIKDHRQFENLVATYFENLDKQSDMSATKIRVDLTGVGADGGRDLLVHTTTEDIASLFFKRTWVVQSKFHETNISTNKIADINIPTLIHSYKAVGYLLICKKNPTSKLTQLFERLEKECTFGYKYQVLTGEKFLNMLSASLETNKQIAKRFFPKYYNYLVKKKML
jgi:hypothetical protein